MTVFENRVFAGVINRERWIQVGSNSCELLYRAAHNMVAGFNGVSEEERKAMIEATVSVFYV